MKPEHHLDDATIVAFAAGNLPEAHGFVASTHLSFCATCRLAVRQAEAVGGSLLSAGEQEAVSDNCRAATLASLEAIAQQKASPRGKPQQRSLPPALRPLLGPIELDNIKWKTKAPGIAKFDIALSHKKAGRLQLLKIAPGLKMPDHGHGGAELTVVLRGSYTDHTGQYRAGDVADLDVDVEHQPMIDKGSECICLIATEAPTRFKSMLARLVQPFVGI